MTIHPKTSGAAIGTSLGILITSVLSSVSGVHLTPEVYAAITSFLGTFGAWLVPSPNPPGPAAASQPPTVKTEVPPASTAPPGGGGQPPAA